MKNIIKVAFLSSITTAAMVYVLLEWRPLRSEGSRGPEVSWAAPGSPASAAPASPANPSSDDEQNNIEIYRKYSASVVNITSTTLAYDYFLRPVPVEAGTGSGAIIDVNGHIVTNYHVIEPSLNGGELEVTTADHGKFKATIVGSDPNNDLAVLKIDAPANRLSAVPLGTSNGLLVGQKVLAIGNPYGLERTLTTGIISATGRSIQAENGRVIENIIQTDAAINPGNSGGPLLNSSGEIIGINAAIVSPANSGSIGIGFAVPADTVRRVVSDVISYGYVRRPYIGVEYWIPVQNNEDLFQRLGVSAKSGLMIVEVSPRSPAAEAGLRGASRQVIYRQRRYPVGGDVLIAFEGKEVTSIQQLWSAIDRHKAGDKVTITVLRENQKLDIPIVLKEEPHTAR